MRSCPFCQAKNRDDAAVCVHCGNDLRYNPAPVATPPTPTGDPLPAPADHYGPAWLLLIAGLCLLLIIAGGAAVFTLILLTRSGGANLGAQPTAQIGQVAPTGTARMNTPTPWPTFTPAATDSPRRTITPQARASLTSTPAQTSIADRLLSPECKRALDHLSVVTDLIKNDPLKVLSDDWRKDLDLAIADMKTYCGSLDSASPIPGKLGQVQKLLNQATSEFEQAQQLWNQAIDQRDPGKAIRAAQHVSEAASYLGQAISQLQNIAP